MAITTVFSTSSFSTTSINILKEFLATYITDCDFVLEKPNLDENTPISKPIIYLEMLTGSSQKIGSSIIGSSGVKVKDYIIEIKINIILDYNTGGSNKCREISDKIVYNWFKYGYLLGAAKLRNPQLIGLREVPKNTWSPFFGGTHIFTARITLT